MNARINRVVLSLSLTAAVGFAFTPVGCGSSIPATVSVPEDANLTRQLRACAAEHEGHLGYAPRAMSFDVKLSDAGYVESIALRDESFRDESLEACMVHALRSLTLDDLPMRLSGSRPRGPVAPESRAFLGQTPVDVPLELGLEACLQSPPCAVGLGLVVGASLIAVTLYIYVNADPSLVRLRPPKMLATSMPTATAVPTATTMPTAIPAEAAKWRPRPNLNRCYDAAAGGEYLWEEFCRAIASEVDREACWSRVKESEQNKRGWCRNRFGKN